MKYSVPGLLFEFQIFSGKESFTAKAEIPQKWEQLARLACSFCSASGHCCKKKMADVHTKVLLFLFPHSGKQQESLKFKTHSYVTMKEKSPRRRQGEIEVTHSNKSGWQIASAVSIHPHNGSPTPWPVIEE